MSNPETLKPLGRGTETSSRHAAAEQSTYHDRAFNPSNHVQAARSVPYHLAAKTPLATLLGGDAWSNCSKYHDTSIYNTFPRIPTSAPSPTPIPCQS